MPRSKRLFMHAAFAFLALALCFVAACGPPPPEETVGKFFNALAEKDLNKARQFLTGKALATHPAPGSQASQIVFSMGKAFQGVDTLKVTDGRASGIVKLNGQLIAETLLKTSQKVLDDIKDPKVKQELLLQMKKGMEKIAVSYSRVPVKLIKKEQGWLISDLR